MDMFTPATTENESPQGQEEFEAVEETHEEEQVEETLEEEQEEFVEDEQPDPEGQSEELILGKFKTADEALKAYQNLEREYTKLRMEQKQTPQPQATQQDDLDMNDPGSIIDAINRDPMGTIAKIAQMTYQQARMVETQEQQFARGLDEVFGEYKDHFTEQGMQQYEGKVQEIMRELGISNQKPSPRVLKMAAQELWGGTKQQSNAQMYQQAKAAARQEIEQTRTAKKGLGAPTGAKVQEVPKTEADLIREAIVAASRSGGMFG